MNVLSWGTTMNWAALTVAILAPCTVETAFERLQGGRRVGNSLVKLTPADAQEIVNLRAQGVPLTEIADTVGVPRSTIYHWRKTGKLERMAMT